DTRNYGGLEGISELREIFAPLLKVPADQLLAGGNASLTFMAQALTFALIHGSAVDDRPWGHGPHKLLCPVPGYDRHFTLAESLGFELLSIPIDDQGPVIAEAQRLADDPAVKGMWLVPMYSNPTGITSTEQRARELAAMPTAAVDFTLLWDSAYGMRQLREAQPDSLDILSLCAGAGHPARGGICARGAESTPRGGGGAWVAGGRAPLRPPGWPRPSGSSRSARTSPTSCATRASPPTLRESKRICASMPRSSPRSSMRCSVPSKRDSAPTASLGGRGPMAATSSR